MDYSLPLAAGGLSLALPPAPLPAARVHEARDPAVVSLQELEGLMGDAAEQEGELAELGQWYRGLPPAEKRAALASVAKSLDVSFGAAAPAPKPALTIFADSALSSPAAEPAAAASTATAPAAAAARPALGDRTNGQAPGKALQMKQLSSKLHVAHSQKVLPQASA